MRVSKSHPSPVGPGRGTPGKFHLESINAQLGQRTDKVDYWKNSNQLHRWVATALLLQLPALIASFYRAARRSARSADIVHAHWLFPAGMVGAVLRRAGAGPLVISVHSTDFHLLRSLPGGRTLARSLVRQCDRIHFVADYLRGDFGNWIGEPKFLDKKSYVVPMGVSDGLFATPLRSHSPTVGFIGRLISSKGVDELIRVCARVKPSNLVIAGTGPEEHALRTLSTRLEVPHTFMGPVSGSAKDAFFAQSDIVVFPSRIYASGRTEGMPVALLEAMRCGRVVLAADVGGIPEVVRHGVNGYLFRAGVRQSFTSLLGSILANWSQYRQVSVAATETGTRFTASRISQDHEAVYQRLLRSV